MLRAAITAAITAAVAFPAFAQQTSEIIGVVVDSTSGQPLPQVEVRIPGTKLGATTNSLGRYAIRGVAAGRITVRVQRLGYAFVEHTITVAPNATANADFRMHPTATRLNPVVAIGYGTQKKEEVTSAVSSVDASDFVQAPARDAASLISGKVPGLAVTTPSGDPTSGTEISLRGVNTLIGSTNPLVLIDGVPGDLNTVAPDDIQAISVLKDASAAAIYGSRASNGVVLITTKKFNGSAPTLRYDGYVSYQSIYRSPQFLQAADYRALIAKGVQLQDLGSTTNWQNEVLRNPLSERENLGISGGSATSSYNASLNYQNGQGIFNRSDNKTVTARVNLGQSMFSDRVHIDFNMLTGLDNHFMGPDYDYIWRQALIRNPTDRIVDSTGAWQERSSYFYTNPLGLINEDNGSFEGRDLRLNGTLTYTPSDRLQLKMLAGTERGSTLTGDATTFKHANTTQSGLNGTASRSTSSSVDQILELTGTYTANIGENHATLLGGYSYQDSEDESFNANNYDFPTDLFGYNQLQQGSALPGGLAGMGSDKSSYRLVGFFTRLNYDWQNRFLLNASVRHEGNSRFGAAHKWGNFPAISAGWQLGNEHFVKRALPFLNELKLRVGYGVTGIAPTSSYLSLTSYKYGDRFPYEGPWVEGISPARNPNPDLRWERKGEVNTGIDYAMFNTRLSGSVDVYQRDTRDMLYNYSVPVPPYLYGQMLANVGRMTNKGVELQVNFDFIRRPGVNWTSTVNWSTNRNRLVSLSNAVFQSADHFPAGYTGEPIQQDTHRIDIGGPIGNFYGYKSVDIDTSGAWIVLDSLGNRISINDAKEKDKHVLGNGLPKQYLAWNNTVRVKNFDLNVNMRGAFGFQILNFERMFYENPTILQYNMLKSAFDPVYGKRPVNYDLAYVSYYIENGDYWKVDNVTLGYTFGKHALRFLSGAVSQARLYVSGSNLLTLTGYKGLDPEVTTRGTDGLSPGDDQRDTYPTTRMFTTGISLRF
jgi:TonB-linked SusC/RagA family outer membrane protein